MGAHSNEEGEKGKDPKADRQLGRISRASPLCAKQAVLFITVIAVTFGEVATFEVGIHVVPTTRCVRDPQNLARATLEKAITNYGPAVEQFSPIIYEPNAMLLVCGTRFKGKNYQSLRVTARKFCDDVGVSS